MGGITDVESVSMYRRGVLNVVNFNYSTDVILTQA